MDTTKQTTVKEIVWLSKTIFYTVGISIAITVFLLLAGCTPTVPTPLSPTQTVTPLETVTIAHAPVNAQTCTVSTGVPNGYLNLRTGSGMQYAVIRVLSEGEVLEVIADGAWLEVKDTTGNHGFINAKYCTGD